MKNKVDINKLIEKKYKGNTLELSDILEEIDLVLNEVADYKTKIANPSDSIPENQESENIAYRMGQVGNRNPISGDLGRNPQYKQQVTADKIAEAEGELAAGKTPQFQITDLTTLITNSKMQVGHPDRELLDDIVRNMGGTPEDTWRNRIRAMTRYTQFLTTPKKVTEENISSAISSLMILNVFKKLSFFTAQPGKQFEYLMAPLIAPDAKVVGEDDTEIYDVEAASTGKYSIKFYKSSNPKVAGSYTKLKKYSTNAGGVKAIIALVREGHIRFGEAFFTTNLEWLKNNKYFPILERRDQRSKVIYFQSGAAGLSKIAVYVKEKEGGYVDLSQFTSAPKGFKPQAPPKQIAKKYSDPDIIEISGKGRRYSTLTRDIKNIEALLPNADRALERLFNNNILNDIPGVMSEITEIAKLSPEERKQRTPELISAIKAYIEQAKAKRQAEIDKERQELQAVQTELEENLEIQEAGDEVEPKGMQFNFDLSRELWAQIEEKDLMINLGDPEIYNKQMLDVSQEVNNHFSYISLIFKKAQELNTNVTRYFATSVEAQQRARGEEGNNTGYGRRAIENANEISSTMEKVITTRKGRG